VREKSHESPPRHHFQEYSCYIMNLKRSGFALYLILTRNFAKKWCGVKLSPRAHFNIYRFKLAPRKAAWPPRGLTP
jgi:hypothetical protein